jgi:methylmalonyl-CoA/ethylmalonyl-CoA epimerase
VSPIAFDHIALALPRIADAVPFYVGVLGGLPHSGMQGGPDFRFGTWRYENGGRLEVIEPTHPESFVQRFLAARGPGIHHVTFKVPSLDDACDRARARGYDIVGYDDSYDDWKTAFLHPKRALGIVVQFAQTSGENEATDWTPPATVANPPAPVSIVGLRMRVSSAERARTQWEEILEGSFTQTGTRMVWRWPDSPMVLNVDVDPSASEGPVAIEVHASRAVALPAGPVPGLGASFQLVPS